MSKTVRPGYAEELPILPRPLLGPIKGVVQAGRPPERIFAPPPVTKIRFAAWRGEVKIEYNERGSLFQIE